MRYFALVLASLLTVSCGGDDTSGNGNGGATIDGGMGGSDAAATDGAVGADSGSGHPDAANTLNTGDESGDQADSGKPGAPCTNDLDCDDWHTELDEDYQAPICLTEADDGFPGGYCTFSTDNSTDFNFGCNGNDGLHVPYSNSVYGDGFCYHRCTDPTDCRTGYRCEGGACMPDCMGDECEWGECHADKYVCLEPQ